MVILGLEFLENICRYIFKKSYFFDGSGSNDKRTSDCILHLLDAGVHVVEGHGCSGGHVG